MVPEVIYFILDGKKDSDKYSEVLSGRWIRISPLNNIRTIKPNSEYSVCAVIKAHFCGQNFVYLSLVHSNAGTE